MAIKWSYGELASGTPYYASTPLGYGYPEQPSSSSSGNASSGSSVLTPKQREDAFFYGNSYDSIYENAMQQNAYNATQSASSTSSRIPVTKEYGRKDYNAALKNYQSVYGDIKLDKAKVEALAAYYAKGGGYGVGQRAEAKDLVQAGLSKDIGTGVSLGGSSMFASRGLNTLAGKELATRYGNIEDTRAGLEMQAVGMMTPYTQMLANLQYPISKQYIDRITI